MHLKLRRPLVAQMASRKRIVQAVSFDPGETNPTVRPAFIALAAVQELRNCHTLKVQVLFAKDFMSKEVFTILPVTYVEIARFFKLNSDAIVGDIIRRGNNGHEFKGRIPTLNDDDLDSIRRWMNEAVLNHSSLTLADVVLKLAHHNNKTISTNALQKVLKKNQIAKTITAYPEEAGRLLLKFDEVTRYITEASSLVKDVNAGFVFNMDESGVNDFANAKTKKVLVDFHSEETTTKYPVRRDSRHTTLVACVSADGTATKTLLIIK